VQIDPKYNLELLVAFTIGATMTASGFVLAASSAWMMGTGWPAAAVAFCVFLVPLTKAIVTYRKVRKTIPGRGEGK